MQTTPTDIEPIYCAAAAAAADDDDDDGADLDNAEIKVNSMFVSKRMNQLRWIDM